MTTASVTATTPVDPSTGGEVVDAHHHLWDPTDEGQDWLRRPGHEPLRRRFDEADLRAAVADGVLGRPVTASVVVQSVARISETRRLLATAAGQELVRGVVGWVDLTADVAAQLSDLQTGVGGGALVGVRHLVQDEPDPDWLSREEVRRGLDAVARAGLTFDLLVRAPQWEAAVALARRHDALRLVLDHAGKPDLRPTADPAGFRTWRRHVREFARAGNLVVKVSGLGTEADPVGWSTATVRPVFDELLEAFGPERLMFGSDWPVCLLAGGYRRWTEAFGQLLAELRPEEQAAILARTARTHYRLTDARRESR